MFILVNRHDPPFCNLKGSVAIFESLSLSLSLRARNKCLMYLICAF
jgi:hypothetical protein